MILIYLMDLESKQKARRYGADLKVVSQPVGTTNLTCFYSPLRVDQEIRLKKMDRFN